MKIAIVLRNDTVNHCDVHIVAGRVSSGDNWYPGVEVVGDTNQMALETAEYAINEGAELFAGWSVDGSAARNPDFTVVGCGISSVDLELDEDEACEIKAFAIIDASRHELESTRLIRAKPASGTLVKMADGRDFMADGEGVLHQTPMMGGGLTQTKYPNLNALCSSENGDFKMTLEAPGLVRNTQEQMNKINQIVVDQNGLCNWYFDRTEEAAEARAYAAVNGLAITTDDEISVLPAGEILTSAFEFSDFYSRQPAEIEPADPGDKYRLMILNAIEKQRGSHVGAALTCDYTQEKGGYEFFMWTGAHPAGRTSHTLLASETSQERLDSHWQGFVANLAEIATSQSGTSAALSLREKWNAVPATGDHFGAIKEISDTEVIQHVGKGMHVSWQRTDLSGEAFKTDDVVQIDANGKVQAPRDRSNDISM